jgi:predicted RNase H-like HicB family nuclease
LTVVFEEAHEGGYIAFIEEIPGANLQGDISEAAKSNLLEALNLIMETHRTLAKKELGNKTVIRESVELV